MSSIGKIKGEILSARVGVEKSGMRTGAFDTGVVDEEVMVGFFNEDEGGAGSEGGAECRFEGGSGSEGGSECRFEGGSGSEGGSECRFEGGSGSEGGAEMGSEGRFGGGAEGDSEGDADFQPDIDESAGFDSDDLSEIKEIPSYIFDCLDSYGKYQLRDLFSASCVDFCSEEGVVLDDVITFFGKIIDDLDLHDSIFFDSEMLRKVFIKSFEYFDCQLSVEIAKLEGEISFFSDFSKFYPGWQNRIRKAAYYAFFVHFGAKRRFEYYVIDDEQIKKDYISHVFGASFESLLDKIHFLDEEILLATLLHDTREDFSKGFLGLLNMSERTGSFSCDVEKVLVDGVDKSSEASVSMRSQKEAVLSYFSEFEASLDVNEFLVGVSDCVEMLTKISSDRNESLIAFFKRIIDFGSEAWKIVLAKMADRHNNLKTFSSGVSVDSGFCSQQIEDETARVYLYLCRKTGMVNTSDWFEDYLEFQNRVKRGDWDKFNVGAEVRTGMRKRFNEEFQNLLSLKCPGVRFGIDYLIEFRSLGYRWMKDELLLLDPDAFMKKFRSYLLFIPKGENPELVEKAREVFEEIFVDPIPESERNRDELLSPLGRAVLNRGGYGMDKRDDGYGMGVFGVFPSQQAYAQEVMGDFHLAYFLEDPDAWKRIEDIFGSKKKDVYALSVFYDFLRALPFEYKSLIPQIRRDVTDRILSIFSNGYGKADV